MTKIGIYFSILMIFIISLIGASIIDDNNIKDLKSKLDSLNIKVEVYHEDCKR